MKERAHPINGHARPSIYSTHLQSFRYSSRFRLRVRFGRPIIGPKCGVASIVEVLINCNTSLDLRLGIPSSIPCAIETKSQRAQIRLRRFCASVDT